MQEQITFDDTEFNNLELVRHIVMRRLREDTSWHQFDYTGGGFEPYILFPQHHNRSRFLVLANQVMWEFIVQGITTPGRDSYNPGLPWFRITDYGHEVLTADRFVPHDPSGYLSEIRAVARGTIGPVVFAYLEEALRCFTRGCYVASVLLLGVAAEAAMLDLLQAVRGSLRDPAAEAEFDSLPDLIRPKHRWLVGKYQALPALVRREHLPESLDVTLTSLADLIRRQRNELGHPQESPPNLGRDQAFVYFRLFPTFVSDLEALADYYRANGL